jgi:hypothetical protein
VLHAGGPALYMPPQFVTPQVPVIPTPIGRPPAPKTKSTTGAGGSLMQQLVAERKTRVKDYMVTHGQTLLQQQGGDYTYIRIHNSYRRRLAWTQRVARFNVLRIIMG